MALVLLLGLVVYPWLKKDNEQQVVQVIRQVRLEKKVERQKAKTVAVSEKKIEKKNLQANTHKTRKPKTVAHNRRKSRGTGTASNHSNGSGRGLKVSQVGALGALGGLRNGARGSSGFNLNSVVNSTGSSLSEEGAGGRGGNPRSIRGKGLVTSAIGSGGEAQGAGGYGTRGKGGGRPGYGSLNIGGGSGAGSRGNAGYFQPLEEEALVEGGLDRDQIAAVINRNKGQVIYCYEKGLQVKPDLSGRVTVDFVISASGRVSSARASNSSLHFGQVDSCIVQHLRTWKFPKPVGNVNVSVSYPFVLRRVSQG
jgi:TonB family protein